MNERAKAILDFWFIQSGMEDWFKKDSKFDAKIQKLFLKPVTRRRPKRFQIAATKFCSENLAINILRVKTILSIAISIYSQFYSQFYNSVFL